MYERQQERQDITNSERKIFEALVGVKEDADNQVLDNTSVLDNEGYFELQLRPKVFNRFIKEQSIPLNAETVRYVNHLVVAEYLKEFNTGSQSW